MTMKRTEKRWHKGMLASDRFPAFTSPLLPRRAMTRAEYIVHRMGRGQATNAVYVDWAADRRSRRQVTRRG